jgi:hypothetical protein
MYDDTRKEIGYSTTLTTTSKTFVIDHPTKEDKYLVHACLEGPEAGVYYRGQGEIIDNSSKIIELPEYVSHLAKDLSIQITPIYNGKIKVFNVSKVENNSFTVYGENGEFFWTVYGSRTSIEIEPNKKDVNIKGNGPYKWI